MSETYKLVFRGEVLEGQHPAVVRRRLGELLSIDDARLERLFSGQPVVIKSEIDQAGAARFQAMFRKAGARLRVAPIEDRGPADGEPAATAFDPEVLPVGSDVLREDERVQWQPRDIDTEHLSLLDPADVRVDPGPPPPPPPDTSRLSLLDP